ncbi:transposase [Exiguobacterium sp. AB2]|uniref:transposase n=1 Tax=Exiguobacterium sp. AB2 TaxID=1484479 RepID=UPI002100F2FE|nr:transposase [Exiguobacterium sp. AB2]
MYWNTGQPGTDPEILIKIILLGPLFNIRSVRQTVERSFADGKKLHGLRFTFYRGNEEVDRANLLAENDSLHSIFFNFYVGQSASSSWDTKKDEPIRFLRMGSSTA